jgi:hypothetical protein
MFAALLMHNVKRIPWYLVIAAIAAGTNTLLVLILSLQSGWAFAVSMTAASAIGAAALPALSAPFKEDDFEL